METTSGRVMLALGDLDEFVEGGRVDLLVLGGDVEGGDAEELEVGLGDVGLGGEVAVEEADSDVEGFGLELELVVDLDEVVDEVGALLAVDLLLVVEEGAGVAQTLFLPEQVLEDLRRELGARLRVPHVQQVAHLQVPRQHLHPLLPPLVHHQAHLHLSPQLAKAAGGPSSSTASEGS